MQAKLRKYQRYFLEVLKFISLSFVFCKKWPPLSSHSLLPSHLPLILPHSLPTPKQSGSQSAVRPLKHMGSDWSRGVHVTTREKERGHPCLQKSAKNVRTRNRAPKMKYESIKACVIGKMVFFRAAISKMQII